MAWYYYELSNLIVIRKIKIKKRRIIEKAWKSKRACLSGKGKKSKRRKIKIRRNDLRAKRSTKGEKRME